MGNEVSSSHHFAEMMKQAQAAGMPGVMRPPFFPSSMPPHASFNAFFQMNRTASSSSSSASSFAPTSTRPAPSAKASTAASSAPRQPSKSPVFTTDSERLDALLDALHTEEFFDLQLAESMSAKALREYFAAVGVDRDSEGRKFVEVADMRAAYLKRCRLGVSELRRRLQARGVSCDSFVERKDFESAFANVSRECPICIDEYKAGDLVCVLPCGHTYHRKCVYEAAHAELDAHQRWPRCPECRNELNRTPGRLSSGERPCKARRC